MPYSASRLPSRFPVGTKFVIESHRQGTWQVFSRSLEFPDGTCIRLPQRMGKPATVVRRTRRSRGH